MMRKKHNKKIFAIAILFLLTATIAQAKPFGIRSSKEKTTYTTTQVNANWLVMYYLDGDNNLYQIQPQLLESIRNIGSSDDVKIAILIDNNQDGDTNLYYLDGTELIEQTWEAESNMADANTIRDFVQKARSDYSCNNEALFLSSNKGSGWQGILCDDTNGENKQVQLPELSQALSETTNDGSDKIDILGIESCMAGMTENAYEIKDYIDYYIAYEDCSFAAYPPYSWPYKGPLTDLISNSDMSPEEFSVNHLNYFESKKFTMARITTVLTVTNLRELSGLKDTIDDLSMFFIDHIEEYRSDIMDAIEQTRILGELWYIDFYLDPVHFLNLLTIDDTEFLSLKENVITSFDTAIVACDHIEDDPVCGLSIHLPRRKADYDHSFRFDTILSSYDNTGFAQDTKWDEFLKTFLQIQDNTPPDIPTLDGPNRGEPGVEYEFTVMATDAEENDMYIYIDWGDGNTTGWAGPFPSGQEVTFKYTWAEQGTYTIQFKSKDYEESEWGMLSVRMPKNKMIDSFKHSWKLLIGKISDIEYDANNRFRFLPINMLDVGYNIDDGFSMMIRNEENGPFPCCGYIDPDEFRGVINNRCITGLWMI